MTQIAKIDLINTLPSQYCDTPLALLFEYHNKARHFDSYIKAQLLIAMCMDNRKSLNIPDNFAYIIRTGGGNLRYSEFKVSYAIAIGKIKYIALIAHNNCGMVNLIERKNEFVNGLVTIAGWTKEKAEEHFMHFAPMFEIENEIDFVVTETQRLRNRYPNIVIAPLFYNIENNLLYFIKE